MHLATAFRAGTATCNAGSHGGTQRYQTANSQTETRAPRLEPVNTQKFMVASDQSARKQALALDLSLSCTLQAILALLGMSLPPPQMAWLAESCFQHHAPSVMVTPHFRLFVILCTVQLTLQVAAPWR